MTGSIERAAHAPLDLSTAGNRFIDRATSSGGFVDLGMASLLLPL
jgi:hypothetical protein